MRFDERSARAEAEHVEELDGDDTAWKRLGHHQQYADLLQNMGRIAESVRMAERAYRLDPAPIRAETFALSLQLDGRPSEAVEVYAKALAEAPAMARPRLLRSGKNAPIEAGQVEPAVAWWSELDSLARAGQAAPFDRLEWRRSTSDLEALVRGVIEGNLDERLLRVARRDLRATHWMMLGEPDSAIAKVLEILSGALASAVRSDPIRSPHRSIFRRARARKPDLPDNAPRERSICGQRRLNEHPVESPYSSSTCRCASSNGYVPSSSADSPSSSSRRFLRHRPPP